MSLDAPPITGGKQPGWRAWFDMWNAMKARPDARIALAQLEAAGAAGLQLEELRSAVRAWGHAKLDMAYVETLIDCGILEPHPVRRLRLCQSYLESMPSFARYALSRGDLGAGELAEHPDCAIPAAALNIAPDPGSPIDPHPEPEQSGGPEAFEPDPLTPNYLAGLRIKGLDPSVAEAIGALLASGPGEGIMMDIALEGQGFDRDIAKATRLSLRSAGAIVQDPSTRMYSVSQVVRDGVEAYAAANRTSTRGKA